MLCSILSVFKSITSTEWLLVAAINRRLPATSMARWSNLPVMPARGIVRLSIKGTEGCAWDSIELTRRHSKMSIRIYLPQILVSEYTGVQWLLNARGLSYFLG